MTVKGLLVPSTTTNYLQRQDAVGVDVWRPTIKGLELCRTERSTLFGPPVCGVWLLTILTVARDGLGELSQENWYLCSTVGDGRWCICLRKRILLVDRASFDVPTDTVQGTLRLYST